MKIRWNRAAFEEVRRSGPVMAEISGLTYGMARAAGDGYEGSTMQGKSRFRGIVYPDTWSARKDNARHNTLVRVLG